MTKVSLTALVRNLLELAREAHSGRSAATVHGGHDRALRQTVMALRQGGSRIWFSPSACPAYGASVGSGNESSVTAAALWE